MMKKYNLQKAIKKGLLIHPKIDQNYTRKTTLAKAISDGKKL